MVGIVKVDGLPGSYTVGAGGEKPKSQQAAAPKSQDALQLSDKAKTAAGIADYVTAAGADPEVRQERIEQARKNIEEGTHRMNAVLKLVAGRINKQLGK
jgi:anti-sigma28 factor (negative regulator of flagellin synthesis)